MSMYLEHFGLREPPFRITPHTEFFFAGGNRGATLEALIYAITHDEGIVKVIGEVGSGKTMLCRMLLERLPAQVETVYLANPSMTRDELLFALADELDIAEPPARVHQLLRGLQQRLVEFYAAGRQIVVLIDEAHAMPAETLEEIRLLSNLESSRHKLLQIVLFGQPELDEILERTSLRQLRERITQNFSLEPLVRQDVGSYIDFRLRAAGYHGPNPFTPAAIQQITEASGGLTRRINIAADKALLAAFSENTHLIDTAQARTAIRDARFGPMPGIHHGRSLKRPATLGAVAALAIAVGAAIAWWQTGNGGTDTTPAAAAPATAPAAPTTPVAAAPVPAAEVRPAVAAEPASGSPAALLPDAPSAAPPPTGDRAVAASEKPAANGLVAKHREAYAAWLASADDSHYVIQLLRARADSVREVESFIERSRDGLDIDQLRIYHSSANGRSWLGVIYGDYPTREAASAAIRDLPPLARASGPYPRTVKMLR